jgi:hypothetical protein
LSSSPEQSAIPLQVLAACGLDDVTVSDDDAPSISIEAFRRLAASPALS